MKKLFILVFVFSIAACSKVANNNPGSSSKVFFNNPDEVSAIASKTLQRFHPDEQLQAIDRISYLQSANSDYAFVFFTSNKASRSLVVKKDHTAVTLDDVSVTVCWGDCDCKVRAIIGNDGSIDVGCSCTTCKVVTSSYQSL